MKNIENIILETVEDIMHLERNKINPDISYLQYGIDSILSIELINKLNKKLNIKLKTTDLFNYTTIRKLSNHIINDIIKDNGIDNYTLLSEEHKKETKYNYNSKEYIEAELLKIVSQTIGEKLNLIDKKNEFVDLGIDSILSIELINKLNRRFNIQLRVTDLFNYSNVEKLVSYINDSFSIIENESLDKNFTGREENVQKLKTVLVNEELNYDKLFEDLESFKANQTTLLNKEKELNNERENDEINDSDIAIIGISGRFPEADNINEFWNNISKGKNCIREFSRWDSNKYYDESNKIPNKTNSKWGGFLRDIDKFDPMFFNISNKEAQCMDPQQRIFLEESYKAIEDAGYSKRMMDETRCGVYVGCAPGEYKSLLKENGKDLDGYMFLGNSESILSARISYFLNLKGPSLSINTACSSSGVAIHLACESIKNNECDMALAGGICAFSRPDFYQHASKFNMLSPTGKCSPFDNEANGFVPAEAVGVLVLKRLKDAIKDNDNIYGVIVGSGINQDGKTNGIMAPNSLSQEELITSIYKKYNINSENISYIEAHGTGTKLGDPIEFEALNKAFRKFTNKNSFCALGSVKANMGHSLTASAVVGVIKTLLCIKNNIIAPSINYSHCNNQIDLEGSPFYINKDKKNWEPDEEKLKYATVSSFGFSGVNAHIVLKEYIPNKEYSSKKIDNGLIIISAKTKRSLMKQIENLLEWINNEGKSIDINRIASNLQVGRNHFEHRVAFIVNDLEELFEKLGNIVKDKEVDGIYSFSNSFINSEEVEGIINCINEKFEEKITYKDELKKLCELYIKGYDIDFLKLSINKNYKKISMSTYEFEKELFWIERDKEIIKEKLEDVHPLLQKSISSLDKQMFVSSFDMKNLFVRDHIINNEVLHPAVNYLEMAFVGADIITEKNIRELKNIYFLNTSVESKKVNTINTHYYKKENKIYYEIFNYKDDKKILLSKGIVENEISSEKLKKENLLINQLHQISGKEFYEEIRKSGYEYGITFKTIDRIAYSRNEAISELSFKDNDIDLEKFKINTFMLDGIFQTGLTLIGFNNIKNSVYIPYSIGKIQILDNDFKKCSRLKTYIKLTKDLEDTKAFDITVFNEKNDVLMNIGEYIVKKQKATSKRKNKEDYIYEMFKKLEEGLIDVEEVEEFIDKGVRYE